MVRQPFFFCLPSIHAPTISEVRRARNLILFFLHPAFVADPSQQPPHPPPAKRGANVFSPMEQMEELDVVAAYCSYDEETPVVSASLERALGIDFPQQQQPQQQQPDGGGQRSLLAK